MKRSSSSFGVVLLHDDDVSEVRGSWSLTARDHHRLFTETVTIPTAEPVELIPYLRQSLSRNRENSPDPDCQSDRSAIRGTENELCDDRCPCGRSWRRTVSLRGCPHDVVACLRHQARPR